MIYLCLFFSPTFSGLEVDFLLKLKLCSELFGSRLNNKGIELQNGRFSRYYIKLYFEKVYFNSKKYVNEKDLYVINKDIYESYKKQIKIADEGLVKINYIVQSRLHKNHYF